MGQSLLAVLQSMLQGVAGNPRKVAEILVTRRRYYCSTKAASVDRKRLSSCCYS